MLEWLERALGDGWKLTPAGGLTGEAFFATKNDKRLFLKRNSSPFLAVLSAEGIVPKLIWTRRMENGDVITAQEWLDGRELKPADMQHQRVANLLYKIHHSTELLHMLMRLGIKPVTSDDMFINIQEQVNRLELLNRYEDVRLALIYLERLLPKTRNQKLVVCHSDLNHNNLLLSKNGKIYLIDWDNASIADPASDFGMVLKWYIPRENWVEWLEKYGVAKDNYLQERMYWYLLHDSLHYLCWHLERKEPIKVMERLKDLYELNEQAKQLFNI
ncbi:phosphotransferase family protein [Oceanobacillus chungangensis]|uniref:Phosphotransferase n=1 Tax=Oceanobacillus chungangensis TaxID=1229152 RepID=A0A3D8PJR9_9BACI|nr:phosphotransferase family protein [Oceanobacillus chungangensis]RDW15912.1 phosphotransferase [Oceanobacillus chungangensis]